MADKRFDTSKDPRFKKVPQNVRRVQVDKRFAHMFDDKRFVETPLVDSRGQKLQKDATKSKLREFYELAGDDKPKEAEVSTTVPKKSQVVRQKKTEMLAAVEEDSGEDSPAEFTGKRNAFASNQAPVDSEEDDSEPDSIDDDTDEDDEVDALEEDEDDVPRGDATTRLALMGCDWDHTSAGDLLVMLRTYLSCKESRKGLSGQSGTVDRVAVYPSQYGLDQMAIEAQSGPQVFSEARSGPEQEEDEAKVNEAMRKYQLQRTKYHYAVAFCDSLNSASWLYDNLDGLDAQGISPGMLDLRFVPEDLEFPHAPREECSTTPGKYQGPVGAEKSAQGHTKVTCSWDEAPAQRKKDLMRKRFSPQELEQMDLDAYLASSSDDDEDAKKSANDLRKLLKGGDGEDGEDDGDDSDFFKHDDDDDSGKEVEGDMEATFSYGASKLEEDLTERVQEKSKGGKVHSLESAKPKSTWAAYLEKRKEKRKDRKAKARSDKAKRNGDEESGSDKEGDDAPEDDAEAGVDEGDLALLAMGEDDEDDRGFNVRGKKRTGKKRAAKLAKKGADEAGEFKLNPNDPRIAKVFSSGDFEIDPTNPEFRPSTGMQAVLQKKREKKNVRLAAPSQPKTDMAAMQTSSSSGATTSRNAPRIGSASGGLQLFAQKKPAPGGEGHQVTGGTVGRKRGHDAASQNAPAPHAGKSKRKKKGRAGTFL